jgi:hypothetical protein
VIGFFTLGTKGFLNCILIVVFLDDALYIQKKKISEEERRVNLLAWWNLILKEAIHPFRINVKGLNLDLWKSLPHFYIICFLVIFHCQFRIESSEDTTDKFTIDSFWIIGWDVLLLDIIWQEPIIEDSIGHKFWPIRKIEELRRNAISHDSFSFTLQDFLEKFQWTKPI